LDKILNENNIKLSVITESKKNLHGTKETKHYMLIYSGVDRHTKGQSGVMIWIHKSISNKIAHYKFWNDKAIEGRLKTKRGHLTILGVYALTEGRDELNEEFYETLHKILDKVNKKDYIMLIGDMNATVRNNIVSNMVGTNGEAILMATVEH
jgi:exonuclease III